MIQLRNLGCAVAGTILFDDLDAEFGSGELVEIWGPNGSGKSTLLRCIAGLFEAAHGDVRIDEDRSLTYVGHKPGFNGLLNPVENLTWFARLSGRRLSPGDCRAALSRVGMARGAHVPCQHLSAGQLRRVALARLIVSGADIWLLDEPMTALDTAGKELVRDLVRTHLAGGGVAICATHESMGIESGRRIELAA